MVYVDDMKAAYRGMIMCHMIADTHDELLTMASVIGVDARWIQHPNSVLEHFDICKAKRGLAVAEGAAEVSQWTLGRMINEKRKRVATA